MTPLQKAVSTRTNGGSDAGPSFAERLRSPGLVCGLLALATLVLFAPVARNDFVNYDDADYVTANAHVQGGLTWRNVAWAFTTGHASNWHPATWLSHMLDCQLFQQQAGAHHMVNVAFHMANTLLLFLILRRMTGAHGRSALVAALFALHPLHVESVAWVSERKDVLSAFFFMLTLGAYVRYAKAGGSREASTVQSPESRVHSPQSTVRGPHSRERRRSPSVVGPGQGNALTEPALRATAHGARIAFYILSLLFFALGLMSKPMLVTVPFVLLLLDYWPLGRFHLGFQEPKIKNLLSVLLEKAPFFALAAASSVVTFLVQQKGGAVSTVLSPAARIANALVAYVRYLANLFWPVKLSVLYPHPGHWPAWEVAVSGGIVAAIFIAVAMRARRRPYLAVGWLWFFGMLIPAIGLVQVGIQSRADRYTYLPLIGAFIMLVWGSAEIIQRWPRLTRAFGVAAGLALGLCGALTVRQVGYWHDSETLFKRAVQVTPNNYLAYNNIGFYLSGKGRSAEAMVYYRKSLGIKPDYEDALNNVGYALAGEKKYAEAIGYYERALRARPGHVEVHNNLGNALSELGKIDEAIVHYSFVLAHQPDHADAHNNLGIALAMQGKLDEAMGHFSQAIRLKPNYASAHSNLGNALAAQHKLDEAIKEYQESLRLNPADPQAHNNLGNALAEQGRLDEAIRNYTEALRLNANNPEAHFNLGIALTRQGQREQARAHYLEALRLKPDYVEARRQLEGLEKSK